VIAGIELVEERSVVPRQNSSTREIRHLRGSGSVLLRDSRSLEFPTPAGADSAAMLRLVVFLVSVGACAVRALCRRRADLVLENLALRQQVTALKKQRPRPALDDTDRAFLVALRESWPGWANRLMLVKADTVAQWNRDRFRRYWAKISRRRYPGRPRVDADYVT